MNGAIRTPLTPRLAAHPTVGHTSALRAIGFQLKAEGHAVAMVLPVVNLPFWGLFSRLWPEVLRATAELPAKILGDGLELLPLENLSLGALWYGAKIPRV
ncbi:MAG: hypothetical protein GY822_03925 [Deltaproteobacteria bacterium]|nr:hypothetical protein [Deltaproteobacteria bacterium]